jgi:uncharacterized membrane protein
MKFRNSKPLKTIGTIGAAYVAGIVIALIVFGVNKLGANIKLNTDVGEIGSYAAIGVAIPLLLFSTDLTALKRISGRALGSFGLLTLSVIAVSVACGFIFESVADDSGKLAGMAIGLYTGGTPNLNAIGSILGVDRQIIAVANLSDMLIGGVFYIFLLVAAKPLLKRFLTAPKPAGYMSGEVKNTDALDTSDISAKKLAAAVLVAFGMTAVGAGIGVLIWYLTGAVQGTMTDYLVPAVMITATVLGIAGSFNKKLRAVKGTNTAGHYLILVFSVALAMSLNFDNFNLSYVYIFLIYATATIGSFLLHMLLCKLCRIDVDCAIVTMTAGLYGPAFIPAVTRQIGDDGLTSVGLLCGSLGYAVGTFIGAGIGALLAAVI